MSQKQTTDTVGHLAGGPPKAPNLRKLAIQAREAYEQKRTKDCLELIQTILLIDPDNAAARWLLSSIESGESPVTEPALPKNILVWVARFDWRQTIRRHRLVLASVSIALGVGIASFYFFRSTPNTVDAFRIASSSQTFKPVQQTNPRTPIPLPGAAEHVLPPNTPQSTPVPQGASLLVNPRTPIPAEPVPPGPPAKNRVVSPDPVPSVASPAPQPLKFPNPPDAPRANGTLAVSSLAAVDIYKDDTYIGSAPVSLDLPPGLQTLEYRHGSLTKKMTHQVNSNETTRATVTFDVDVQINSKPWAEVFVDGVERKALGQTPLSGVRVPIGSVLVFENPGFPEKKYRVTGNETGIQMVFP
jgi:hypothetical protein